MTDTKPGPGALDTSVAGVSTSLPKESTHMPPDLLYSLGQLEDFVARLAQVQAPPGLPGLEADVRAAVAASRDPAVVERLEHVRAAASLLGQKLEPLMDLGGHFDPRTAWWSELVVQAWCGLMTGDCREDWIYYDIATSVADGIVGAPDDVDLAVQIALEALEERIGDCYEREEEWVTGLTWGLIPEPAVSEPSTPPPPLLPLPELPPLPALSTPPLPLPPLPELPPLPALSTPPLPPPPLPEPPLPPTQIRQAVIVPNVAAMIGPVANVFATDEENSQSDLRTSGAEPSGTIEEIWGLADKAVARLDRLTSRRLTPASGRVLERLGETLLELAASLRALPTEPRQNNLPRLRVRNCLVMDAVCALFSTESPEADFILDVAELAADAVMAEPDDEEAAVQLARRGFTDRFEHEEEVESAEWATRFVHAR